MLKIGDPAPDFEVQSAAGGKIVLAEGLRDGPVVLSFQRYAGCPICQMRISELVKAIPEFTERRARLFIVLESRPERIHNLSAKAGLPDVFIPDPDRKLYDLFLVRPGTWSKLLSLQTAATTIKATLKGYMHGAFEGDERQLPADFVIGRDRIVHLAHYGENPADNATNDQLLGVLDRISDKTAGNSPSV